MHVCSKLKRKLSSTTTWRQKRSGCKKIWSGESRRLHRAALRGECKLTSEEQWAVVKAMPEAKEQTRLMDELRPHYEAPDELINQMWAIPGSNPGGKGCKNYGANLLCHGGNWREGDGAAGYDIPPRARDLMIELVGGEPAAQLRDHGFQPLNASLILTMAGCLGS
jgi:hypothetical protein